jgi:hypothetical protein
MNTYRPLTPTLACCIAALLLYGAVTDVSAQALHSETDQRGHRTITNVTDTAPPSPAGRLAVAYYKQVDADNRVSYGDGTDAAPALPQPPGVTVYSNEVASALARNAAMSSRRAARIDASEATRRLAQAKRERQSGIAPLPGEDNRITAPGAAIGRYQLRQNRLNSRVESAQLRVSYTQR